VAEIAADTIQMFHTQAGATVGGSDSICRWRRPPLGSRWLKTRLLPQRDRPATPNHV